MDRETGRHRLTERERVCVRVSVFEFCSIADLNANISDSVKRRKGRQTYRQTNRETDSLFVCLLVA